jgi:RNA-directed DNA polymerase
MSPLDPARFIYSLAGAMTANHWTIQEIRAEIRNCTEGSRSRLAQLAVAITTAFPIQPSFDALAKFLESDRSLRRALARGLGAGRGYSATSRSKSFAMQPPPARLRGIAIPQLPTEIALANWFGIETGSLRWRSDLQRRNRKHPPGKLRLYTYRWIPRRNGLPRLLEIPKVPLKRMQRKILTEILDAIPAHPAAHGFLPGRSIVTNAAIHCGKSTVLRFDLVDFFPSVTSARIFRIFRAIGYPDAVAHLLTGICTAQLPADVWEARPGARLGADFDARQRLITRHLPQGAPTSPALANLAAHRLDRRLSKLATVADAVYTRYADDLTFSGGHDLARARKRFETLVAVIAHEEGFTLNHRKTRLMRSGVRQHVTGVVVNVRPNIRRTEFDALKAILTNCLRRGPAAQNRTGVPDFRAHLAGKLAQFKSIHPQRAEKLLRILEQIKWDDR